jgi:beta-ureidopropionase / N-carbamoyl-L-amino-acid hydrolase
MEQPLSLDSLRIDMNRLRSDLITLGQIGQKGEGEADIGLYRVAFSDADLEGRRWLLQRIEQAGLKGYMDKAINVFGTLPGREKGPSLLVGSHTDTVPNGGILDGALGVLAGLECLRVMKEAKIVPRFPVELVNFCDEEGRFGGMLGSQALVGDLNRASIFSKRDPDGISLKTVMEKQGLDPMGLLEVQRQPETVRAFLELHIEQGPVLDHLKKPVGVVDGIAGLFKWKAKLLGKANHAGATPMTMRQDVFMGLADFAKEIPRVLNEDGTERSRATIGKVDLIPGFPHTIPGEVDFSLVVRDTDRGVMEELEKSFRKVLSAIARSRNLRFEYVRESWIAPTTCDPDLVKRLVFQAERLAYPYEVMPSGAGHDAQFVSRLCPVAMLFVPSKDGVSHAPQEWTDWDDVEKGANLLLHSIIDLSEAS